MRFVKTSLWLKLAILAVCVFCVASLISIQTDINKRKQATDALKEEIISKNQAVLQLEEDIDMLNSDEGTRKIARQRLGYVEDGEIVFYDNDN